MSNRLTEFASDVASYVRFHVRTGFKAASVRSLSSYRRVMGEYLRAHPVCAFCGKGGKLDVHHKAPVSVAPELADDPDNLITLHRKPACHHVVGHLGDWRNYNRRVTETCQAAGAI